MPRSTVQAVPAHHALRHAAELRRCLLDLDVVAVRRLYRHMAPHLPQPADDREALVTLHMARTQESTLPVKARAWSHRWLLDHGYPSGLPDRLRPMADRLYPKVVETVIVSATAITSLFKPIAPLIQGAMETVALDTFASDRPVDHRKLRVDLREAHDVAIKRLFGPVLAPLAQKQSEATREAAAARLLGR